MEGHKLRLSPTGDVGRGQESSRTNISKLRTKAAMPSKYLTAVLIKFLHSRDELLIVTVLERG